VEPKESAEFVLDVVPLVVPVELVAFVLAACDCRLLAAGMSALKVVGII
jgi:hypothetical protein